MCARTSVRSIPRGLASSSTSTASRSRCQVRGRISSATASEAIGSSRVNPVAAITIPLTITARAPKASEATSRNAPRTLRLCACPRRSSSSDTPFPASATTPKTIIRPEPTGRRCGEPLDRLDDDERGQAEQQQRVDGGGQDLGAGVAEGAAVGGGPGRHVGGEHRQADAGRVGGHVRGVGQQHQGAADQRADDLRGGDPAADRHDRGQLSPRCLPVAVRPCA